MSQLVFLHRMLIEVVHSIMEYCKPPQFATEGTSARSRSIFECEHVQVHLSALLEDDHRGWLVASRRLAAFAARPCATVHVHRFAPTCCAGHSSTL